MFGFMAVERFPEHVGALPELTAFRVIEGPVSHVRDGDTIEVEIEKIGCLRNRIVNEVPEA